MFTETETDRHARREADRQRAAAAVEALESSEGWQTWLRARSKFHNYSFTNQLLIAMQCREATHVTSRGFGYLKDANRLDITVEWLVYDSSRVYHHLFDAEMIDAAGRRLIEHGFSAATASDSAGGLPAEAIIETADGFALELSAEVTRSGAVVLRAGEVEQAVDSVLAAVGVFVDLLAQVDAAAAASRG